MVSLESDPESPDQQAHVVRVMENYLNNCCHGRAEPLEIFRVA